MAPGLVAIGASLGGLRALEILLGGLPRDFAVPVAVVLHRRPDAETVLCDLLSRHGPLPAREPDDKAPLEPGRVYVAPADYHLLVEPGHFALSTEGRVSFARPSVDVLFETAAEAYGEGVVGVVLTGSNRDGARGAARIKARGGTVLVQDPATAESPVMPGAAIAAAPVDRVLPLEELAPHIAARCRKDHGGRP